MAPTSIHEIFKMRCTISIGNCPFLLIFWSAWSNTRLDRVSKTHGYTELLLLFSTASAHWSQYLSTTAIPLPTSNNASLVAGWPQSWHALAVFERLLQVLIEEKILFIVIYPWLNYKNVGFLSLRESEHVVAKYMKNEKVHRRKNRCTIWLLLLLWFFLTGFLLCHKLSCKVRLFNIS